MNKRPHVERCPSTGGITGQCAYEWALFLAQEADMNDDVFAYDRWKHLQEQLTPMPGVPIASSVHIRDLEKEIEKWNT